MQLQWQLQTGPGVHLCSVHCPGRLLFFFFLAAFLWVCVYLALIPGRPKGMRAPCRKSAAVPFFGKKKARSKPVVRRDGVRERGREREREMRIDCKHSAEPSSLLPHWPGSGPYQILSVWRGPPRCPLLSSGGSIEGDGILPTSRVPSSTS